jgi:replicative DNA helicase
MGVRRESKADDGMRPLNEETPEPYRQRGRRITPIDESRGDRIPPHSNDAEQSVLGAMMLDRDAAAKVLQIVDAEAFYREQHRIVFTAMANLAARSEPIDLVTVNEELRRVGKLDDVGGIIYLSDLTMRTVTSAYAERHARIVYEKACRRAQIRFSMELIARAYDDANDAFENLEFAETEMSKLARRPSGSTAYHYATLFTDVVAEIERRQAMDTGMAGMACGLHDLDRRLSGFQRKDNVVLAARPAMGKTGIGLEIAEGLAANGHPGLIISLEMSALSLGMRSVARHGRVDAEHIRGGDLSKDEWQKILAAVERLARLGIIIEDGSSLSIGQMRALVKRYKRTHGIEFALLDYLQLGTAPGMGSRELEISAISRGGKQIAKENDICWIALAQLNRGVESRGDKRPMLSDLRESGSIEADADVVMFLYRPEYYGIPSDADGNSTEGVAEVIVAKQRSGPTGTVKLAFRPEWIAFENWSPRDNAPSALDSPDARFGSHRTWSPPPSNESPF